MNINIIAPWWQIETFSALLALCVWNSPVTGEFPHKGQWRGALMFSLIWAWTNGWVSNQNFGDLRGHHAHYDVTVVTQSCIHLVDINITALSLVYICIFGLHSSHTCITAKLSGPSLKQEENLQFVRLVYLHKHMITCNRLGMYLPLFTIPYTYTSKRWECLPFWQNAANYCPATTACKTRGPI